MDCDLQDPPEDVPRLLATAREGYDIVFARRMTRQHSGFRRWGARLYSKLVNRFTRTRLDGDFGSFTILSRKVVGAFLTLGDTSRHYLFILNWLGFESTCDRCRARRSATAAAARTRSRGSSGTPSTESSSRRQRCCNGSSTPDSRSPSSASAWRSAWRASYSWRRLRPGWTSLAVLILLIGGFIIIGTGVAGLYIGKIFDQVKGRPLFVIDERLDEQTPEQSPTN